MVKVALPHSLHFIAMRCREFGACEGASHLRGQPVMDLRITGALLSAIAVFVMPAVSTKLMTAASAKHSDKVAETSRLSDMVRAFADLSEFGDLGFTDMSARRRYRVARHPVWRHHAARHRDQRLALTPGEQHDVGGALTSW